MAKVREIEIAQERSGDAVGPIIVRKIAKGCALVIVDSRSGEMTRYATNEEGKIVKTVTTREVL